MNADGPELRDIHLPPDPSWWPPAPGWWLVCAIVLIAIAWLARHALQRHRARRWRQRVHAQVARIAASHAVHNDPVRLACEVSHLLRRASLLLDANAAAFPGERWLEFLDAQIGGEDFRGGPGRVLLDAPWRRNADIDANALLALTSRWLDRVIARRDAHA